MKCPVSSWKSFNIKFNCDGNWVGLQGVWIRSVPLACFHHSHDTVYGEKYVTSTSYNNTVGRRRNKELIRVYLIYSSSKLDTDRCIFDQCQQIIENEIAGCHWNNT